jgi:hypothetical protein
LAELEIDLHTRRGLLAWTGDVTANRGIPSKEGSVGRVWAPELGCGLVQTVLDLLAPGGVRVADSIEAPPAGGKLEYQLSVSTLQRFTGGADRSNAQIIAERGLGLPCG